MSPHSGNWYWITANKIDLRYALTHSWRIDIIFLTMVLYTYICWYVRFYVGVPLSQPRFTRLTQPCRATVAAMHMQLVDKCAGGTRNRWTEELTTR